MDDSEIYALSLVDQTDKEEDIQNYSFVDPSQRVMVLFLRYFAAGEVRHWIMLLPYGWLPCREPSFFVYPTKDVQNFVKLIQEAAKQREDAC